MDQVDDLARVRAASDDCEDDDRERSYDDLDRWEAASTWGPRGLEVEGRVRRRGSLQVEGFAGHNGGRYIRARSTADARRREGSYSMASTRVREESQTKEKCPGLKAGDSIMPSRGTQLILRCGESWTK